MTELKQNQGHKRKKIKSSTMEKYKKFTDAGTGINPFVPFIPKNTQSSIASKLLFILRAIFVSPILFLIKLVFLLCFTVAYTILSTLFSMIPLWFIRRPLERYLNALFMRAYLVVFGFFAIESSHVNTNNRLQLLSSQEIYFGSHVNHGDVIICNHVSYVELFYLAFRFAPTFATVVKREEQSKTSTNEAPKYALVRNGFLGALLNVITENQSQKFDASSTQSLSEIAVYCKQNHLGPVVVFPEVVSSNGRSLLTFESSIFRVPGVAKALMDEKIKIHLIGFKFECQNFSPSFHHTSSFFKHLYHLTTQFYNKLIVKHVHLSQTERQQVLSELQYPDHLRNYLASALKLQPVSSSANDKANFKDYWNKTQSRDYAKEE